MSGPNEKGRKALDNLAGVLIEDIIATPDEEILAEAGDNAKAVADAMRSLFERSLMAANKSRLEAARLGLARDQSKSHSFKLVNSKNIKAKFNRALAACPPDVRLTLAARNEEELSDSDVLGMLQDLEELGISSPNDDGNEEK